MPITGAFADSSFVDIDGVKTEIIRVGSGKPLLYLHAAIGIQDDGPFIDALARHFEVIAPSHPGFGRSEQPEHLSTVDDLSYFYLDLLEQFDLSNCVVLGMSFGGWIAAEIAVKTCVRLSHLVLVDPVGIRIGERDKRDIVDIFALTPSELIDLSYEDPRKAVSYSRDMSEEELLGRFRNREASGWYGWSPYMHNPKLKQRLHRVSAPTLLLWGENDRIVRPDYGRTYAELIPGADFELVEKAGHYPHMEQPEAVARRVVGFASREASVRGMKVAAFGGGAE